MMNYLKTTVLFTVVVLALARAEPDVTVSGTTYNSGAVVNEWAQYTLQTGGTVTVKDGANISFSAGSRITLYPGFNVEPGGTFNATTSAIPSYNPGGYYNGFTPTLAPLSGDQQYGTIGQFNLQPFDVLVWNAAGTAPLVNAPVLLTVNIGGGWLSATNGANPTLVKTLHLMTDGDGTVHAYYQQGSTVEVTSYIQVVAGTQILQFTTYSTLDIAIPTVPAGLAASNISTSGFTLSWNASHDDIAVTGYDVFKDGLFVGSSVTTSYVVTGLVPETTYSMTVKAKDADSHVSAASAPLAVTTPDVTAPSVPANLTASNLTTTGVTLTWTASTDNIAVTGYDIYQNNVLIGSSSAPTYTVAGLTPVMGYSFTVKAKDAAGNVSAASSAVSVTTLTPVTPIAEVAGSFRTGKTSAAVPTGTNRMLVFVAQSETSGTLNSVTYGGRSLIRAVALTNSTNETSIWYLDDAGIASATNTTFVTSWSGSESGEGYSNFFLTGVDQANPVKAIRSAADPYTTANVSVSTSSITVANGDYSVFAPVRGGAAGAFTFGGGFTERLHYAITSGDAALATRVSTTGETITPAVSHATAAERMTLAVCVFQPAPYEIAPKVAVSEVAGSFTTGKTSASVPTGANRLLVFVAQSENSGTLNSVTYGGQNMTLAANKAEGINEVSIWYLNDAGIAAATGTGFVTSWSGPESVEGYSSFFLRNVGQVTPVGLTSSFSSVYTTVNVHVSIAGLAVGSGDYVAFAVVQGQDPAVFTFAGGFTERLHYAIESGDAALATRAITVDTAVTPSVAHSLLGNRIALAACVFKPAPSAPANLVASAVTTTGFTLVWDAAFDNTAVTGYDVYKNGVFVGATNTLSYGVTGLSAGTAYTMTVKARDADGNASAASAPLVVTTSTDGQAPSVPAGLATSNLGATGFTLTWSASTDNIGVTGYDIFKDGVLLGTSVAPSYAVTGLAPLTAYSMTVKARDAVGNVSAASAALSVTTTADTTAPVAPAGLSAASLATTGFTLNWSAATDNIGVTGYDIFKDGVQIGSSATLTYAVSGLAPLTTYSMTVKAKDAASNVSAASVALSVTTTADTAAPTAPTGLTASGVSTTSFTLSWAAATDNVAVTAYEIFQNGALIGSSTTLSHEVTGLAPGTAYNMTVKAKDAAGNSSAASATLAVTTSTDSEVPTAPSSLVESNLATTSFTLSWSAATDNISVTGYTIFKDGVQIGTSATLSYAVTGLSPLTSYSMTVKARDAANNISVASSALTVTTTADTAAPTAPTNLSSSAVATTGFILNWVASTDNVAVTGYDIFKDGVQIGSSATLTYAVSNLAPQTAYSITVKAKDAAGNASAASQALSVTTLADTAAPTAPTALVASNLVMTGFTLTWTASTDNVAVTGYDVFQDGVQIGSTATLDFAVTNLAAGTTYAMTVKAKDAAANVSTASVVLTVTTLADVDAPTVPTALVSSDVGATSFTLTWSASTDNVTAQSALVYDVYRGGTLLGATAAGITTYSITGLTPSTAYSMTVRARDTAATPNNSAQSSALVVTTTADTTAPTVPDGLAASAITATSFTLTWSASTDNVTAQSALVYDVYRGGTLLGTTAAGITTYSVTGLTYSTAYSMTVRARDTAATPNNSAQSSALVVTTTADTTAPTVPAGLAASAITATSFTLTWSASADNVTAQSALVYDVYRGGALLGTTAAGITTYPITGLTPSTAYSMTVRARDTAAVPNNSAQSSALVVTTTADTTAPAVPMDLVATSVLANSVTFEWTASTDNVAVTGYDIYKNGSLAGSSATNSYVVGGLTDATAYTLTVSARDAANNVSAASAALSVTTPDVTVPTAPANLVSGGIVGSSVTLSWSGSSDNVGVAGYNIYQDGVLLGTSTTVSYATSSLLPASVYTFTVKARDAAGNLSTASNSLVISAIEAGALSDVDGDLVPDEWEVKLGTDSNNAASVPAATFVVSPAYTTPGSGGTPANGRSTITAAINAVSNGTAANPTYAIIEVREGSYAESVVLNNGNVRIALIAKPTVPAAKVEIRGDYYYNYVMYIGQPSVVSGFRITRQLNPSQLGSNHATGIVVSMGTLESQALISNCVIHGHRSYSGGALDMNYGNLILRHVTMYDNYAADYGNGNAAYVGQGTLSIENSIVWNQAGGAVDTIYCNDYYGSVIASGSIIYGGEYGGLNADPLLNPFGFLKAGSPAINLGEGNLGIFKDIQREVRTGRPDAGADEFIDSNGDGVPDNFGGGLATGNPDGDTLNNLIEYGFGSDPTLPDTDGDNLLDGGEFAAGTNPLSRDSDGDGMEDGYEVTNSLNPLINDGLEDKDGDLVPNLWEAKLGAQANNAASVPASTFIVSPAYTTPGSGGAPVNGRSTIMGAINAVSGGTSDSPVYVVIEVREGSYPESINLYNSSARVALIAKPSVATTAVELCGDYYNYNILYINQTSVISGFRITRRLDVTVSAANHATGINVSMSESTGRLLISNSVINGHRSSQAGALYVNRGDVTLRHVTMYDNQASAGDYNGNAIYINQGALRIENSIVWNQAGGAANTIYGSAYYATVTTGGSIVYGGEYGGLNADPLLSPVGLLKIGSPAVNLGLASLGTVKDMQGEARAGVPDAGADELIDSNGDGVPDNFGGGLATGNPDSDTLNNLAEYNFGSDPTLPDTDGDNLNDGAEQTAGTDPRIKDSDSDGMEDGYEVTNSLNPLINDALEDKDGDLVPNLWEAKLGTQANNATSVPASTFVVSPGYTTPGSGGTPLNGRSTIMGAITAVSTGSSLANPTYAVIEVREGTYSEAVQITNPYMRVALIAKPVVPAATVELRGGYYGSNVVYISQQAVVSGFRITRQLNPSVPLMNHGSGINILTNSRVRSLISNCIIHGHRAYAAGALYISSGDVTLRHVTFYDNFAETWPEAANAIYLNQGALRVENSIIWGQSGGSPQTISVYPYGGTTVTVAGSIIYGGELEALGSDPMLNPLGLLKSGSPAINLGQASIGTVKDMQAESRVGLPDAGADEWIDTDTDELPDSWEMLYFGNLTSQSGTSDGDSDGWSNVVEYNNSTSPLVYNGVDQIVVSQSVDAASATPQATVSFYAYKAQTVTLKFYRFYFERHTSTGGFGTQHFDLLDTRTIAAQVGLNTYQWDGIIPGSPAAFHDADVVAVEVTSLGGPTPVTVGGPASYVPSSVGEGVTYSGELTPTVFGRLPYENTFLESSYSVTRPMMLMTPMNLAVMPMVPVLPGADRLIRWVPIGDDGKSAGAGAVLLPYQVEARYLPVNSIVYSNCRPEVTDFTVQAYRTTPSNGEVVHARFNLTRASKVSLVLADSALIQTTLFVRMPNGTYQEATNLVLPAGSHDLEFRVLNYNGGINDPRHFSYAKIREGILAGHFCVRIKWEKDMRIQDGTSQRSTGFRWASVHVE